MQCVFCAIAEHKMPAKIVYEDAEVVAFHDINPQAPVHILVIPRKHIEKVSDTEETDQPLLGKLVITGAKIAKDLGINDSGFRMVFNNGRDGGQHVYHIHLHVLGGRKMTGPPG